MDMFVSGLLLLPPFFIGLVNEELEDSMTAMLVAIIGTILLTAFTRSLPALLGIFPGQADLFVFQQVGETLSLLLPLVPIYALGTMAGLLVKEFVMKPRLSGL